MESVSRNVEPSEENDVRQAKVFCYLVEKLNNWLKQRLHETRTLLTAEYPPNAMTILLQSTILESPFKKACKQIEKMISLSNVTTLDEGSVIESLVEKHKERMQTFYFPNPTVEELAEIAKLLNMSSNGKFSNVKGLLNWCFQIFTNITDTDTIGNYTDECNVINKTKGERFLRMKYEADKSKRIIDHAKVAYHRTLDDLNGIKSFYSSLSSTVNGSVLPLTQRVEGFLEHKITKLELANAFSSYSLSTEMERLIRKSETLYDAAFADVKEASQLLEEGYTALVKPGPPVVTNDNVYQLEIVKAAKEINNSTIQNMVQTLGHDVQINFIPLIRELSGGLHGVVFDLGHTSSLMEDMLTYVSVYNTSLLEYQESGKLDSEFYMKNFVQVDIFYEELSYEHIEQNKAFEFLSLLSEIGGFLGLLLGASVLTVCELVDYLTLYIVHALKKKKQTRIEDLKESDSSK